MSVKYIFLTMFTNNNNTNAKISFATLQTGREIQKAKGVWGALVKHFRFICKFICRGVTAGWAGWAFAHPVFQK